MARGLVERNGTGESADAVWKALNAEHQKKLLLTAPEPAHVGAFSDLSSNMFPSDSNARVLVQELIDSSSIVIFGQ
jgi:hypothetical protein